ncbi:expressed protein [Phakopsora pachyrhizi]|uniref:Expressed protein n=1 Tax=Phakopsora pachyrhizi TaxID=170000 RepID=A0AAV0B0T8_PHAPC|nr:expressed protein [Phakopsora pachyrhizi]
MNKILFLAVSKSEAGVLLKASKDVEDTNQNILEEKHIELLTKLQDLRKEFHNSSDKKVYSNLQSLLNNLKDYYSKDRSQMNLNDDVSLLSNKKLEDLILKDFDKVFEHISPNFYSDFNIENSPATPFAFHIIDWLALNELGKRTLLYELLKNGKVMEGLDWYTSSQIILKRGYIDFFKTDNIKSHILKHQDLEGIRNLLKYLDKIHWMKLELGFIRAHLIPFLDKNTIDPFVNWNTVSGFEEILKAMEEAHGFDPVWLKALSMDSKSKNAPMFFVEKVFVLHALSYCQKYFKNFNLEKPMTRKVEYFKRSFDLFRKQLMMYEELVDSENVSKVLLPDELSILHYVFRFKRSTMEEKIIRLLNTPAEPEIEFAKAVEDLDKNWKSKFVQQCGVLDKTQKDIKKFYSSVWISPSDEEFIYWVNDPQYRRFNNELFALNELFMEIQGFLI